MTNFGMIQLMLTGILEQLKSDEYHNYNSGLEQVIKTKYGKPIIRFLNYEETIEILQEGIQKLKENQE